jgi:hypothetical protein
MEKGFVYDRMQGAYISEIGNVTLIQRANERQIGAFIGGKCVETFTKRSAAKQFAIAKQGDK